MRAATSAHSSQELPKLETTCAPAAPAAHVHCIRILTSDTALPLRVTHKSWPTRAILTPPLNCVFARWMVVCADDALAALLSLDKEDCFLSPSLCDGQPKLTIC